MASEEERAAILAEYMKGANNDDGEEEAEFHPDDDEGSDDDSTDSDNDEENSSISAILIGSLALNEEGNVVYSGTWRMKHASSNGSSEHEGAKFKLKSKKIFTDGDGGKFDLCNPVGGSTKRSLLFHGFFVVKDVSGEAGNNRKVKEKDVEITFTLAENLSVRLSSSKNFHVLGSGSNEFGAFTFKGEYKVKLDGGKVTDNSLVCEKKYVSEEKRSRAVAEEDDDDALPSDADEGADLEELAALHEEAYMSVEELRKRYELGTDDNDDTPARKKVRKEPESDDEYTF